jgi:hypothetical protein
MTRLIVAILFANATNKDDDEDYNDHDNNSVQFNGYLLTCRLNRTSANYRDSRKTQRKSEDSLNMQKQYPIFKVWFLRI